MSCCDAIVNGAAPFQVPFAVVRDQTQTVGAVASTRDWVSIPDGGAVEAFARISGTMDDADSGAYRAQEGHGARTVAAGIFVITPIDVPGGFSGATAGAPAAGTPAGWLLNAFDITAGIGLHWGVVGAAGQTIDWSIEIFVWALRGGAVLL